MLIIRIIVLKYEKMEFNLVSRFKILSFEILFGSNIKKSNSLKGF